MELLHQVHDSVTVETSGVCRLCEQEKNHHTDGKCLFEATAYVEMSMAELMAFTLKKLVRKPIEIGQFKQEYLCSWPSKEEREEAERQHEMRLLRFESPHRQVLSQNLLWSGES
jgi:hypothetical protein